MLIRAASLGDGALITLSPCGLQTAGVGREKGRVPRIPIWTSSLVDGTTRFLAFLWGDSHGWTSGITAAPEGQSVMVGEVSCGSHYPEQEAESWWCWEATNSPRPPQGHTSPASVTF